MSVIVNIVCNLIHCIILIWGISGGDPIIVQVVDDGIDATHEDLAPNVDLVYSYDCVDQDTDPTPQLNNSHGTSCAGIIGARAFNGKGVRGIAPFVKLIGLNRGITGLFFINYLGPGLEKGLGFKWER